MASTHLSRTLGTATSTKKLTFSLWVKRSSTGSSEVFGMNHNADYFYFNGDAIDFEVSIGRLKTNRLFRDTSAWYHIVVSCDTTLGTADDRFKMYINGVQETSFASRTNPSQNADFAGFNTANQQTIGKRQSANDLYFNGLLSHYHFIDGTAYTPTSFGEVDATSGIWKAKSSASVTYGNNGFFLKFENSGAMGTDSSGNSNNFTVSGTLTQNVDTPDNNFATINPLYYSSTGLLNGNITATSTGNSHKNYHSTIAVDSGKWYAEMKVNSWNGSNNIMFGIVADSWNNINSTSPGDNFAGNASTGIGYGSNGQKIIANSASSYGNSFTTGDILGIALDLTNNKLYFSKNGTYQNSGVPTSGSTGTGAIDVPSGFTRLITFSHYGSQSCSMNFGNGYFGTTAVASANADGNGVGKMEYAVPTGYYTLNTKNIKEFG